MLAEGPSPASSAVFALDLGPTQKRGARVPLSNEERILNQRYAILSVVAPLCSVRCVPYSSVVF